MLDLTGNVLNWLAAGVLFPCLFLPLASLLAGDRLRSTVVWGLIVAAVTTAGVLFTTLTPVLRAAPSAGQGAVFSSFVTIVAIAIYLGGGARAVTEKLAHALAALVSTAGKSVAWLLIAMALVQFAVVIFRYVFGENSILAQEAITYMHGAVFLVAGGYALLTNDHVRVDIFYRDAPAKRKALVDFAGAYLFLFPVCLVLIWTASPYVAQSWAVSEGSAEASGIQAVFLLKSLIPLFAFLLAGTGFVVAARASRTLAGLPADDDAPLVDGDAAEGGRL